jgi:hypothetical protein
VYHEDSQDLLGHKSNRITTHYSVAGLLNLWEAANKVRTDQNRPVLTLLIVALRAVIFFILLLITKN